MVADRRRYATTAGSCLRCVRSATLKARRCWRWRWRSPSPSTSSADGAPKSRTVSCRRRRVYWRPSSLCIVINDELSGSALFSHSILLKSSAVLSHGPSSWTYVAARGLRRRTAGSTGKKLPTVVMTPKIPCGDRAVNACGQACGDDRTCLMWGSGGDRVNELVKRPAHISVHQQRYPSRRVSWRRCACFTHSSESAVAAIEFKRTANLSWRPGEMLNCQRPLSESRPYSHAR